MVGETVVWTYRRRGIEFFFTPHADASEALDKLGNPENPGFVYLIIIRAPNSRS
jgi:hypothetical protein